MNQGKYKELIEIFHQELMKVQSDALGEKKSTMRVYSVKNNRRSRKNNRQNTLTPIFEIDPDSFFLFLILPIIIFILGRLVLGIA